ncbi:MAG TPA: AMP-binding protein, partial [Gemmatimonadales bacterium]|nr:AMP-binding protein [Gemmatimonadales bacterium]
MADPRTLNEIFFGAMDRNASRPVAMRSKQADRWVDISFAETLERVRCIAAGLRELGVKPGSNVAILSEN